jgi:hypothetical protein
MSACSFFEVSLVGRSYHCRCAHCGARFWYSERSVAGSGGTGQRAVYNLCCKGGFIVLPKFTSWYSPLNELAVFGGFGPSTEFMCLIRSYNAPFFHFPWGEG